ncbi:hypothetical protein N7509_013863 [Penicillium cosmopolitanum]|uniref:Uncharacterized protein n=1 Tax=Penicillium cosmopolitanum TaxID=1131564 RepID=A0A9W9VCJ2_9EURO|nr:uncharacterized protein N7509_013863 [Penicillium cosmopolitanum]KAJ5376977.1 hypothetical protein N7509_013863 [Penicillium cosmopolitanum]
MAINKTSIVNLGSRRTDRGSDIGTGTGMVTDVRSECCAETLKLRNSDAREPAVSERVSHRQGCTAKLPTSSVLFPVLVVEG